MPSSPRAAWKRLGDLLRDRRITELDPRYRNRRTFVKETGLSYSVTSNIETGVRDDYGPDTLKAVERAYRWQAGSIQAVLNGGEPTPINPTVRISGVSVSTEPVTNATYIDDELAEAINDATAHGVDVAKWNLNDKFERMIFTYPATSFNWEEKVEFRSSLLAYRAKARERQRRENGAPMDGGAPES